MSGLFRQTKAAAAHQQNVERRFYKLWVAFVDLFDLGVVDAKVDAQVELVAVNAPGDLQ